MNEADMAVYGFVCDTYKHKVAHCSPAVQFTPYYIFSRYPQETTKIWNLLKLLTPTSWFWTFLAILSMIIMLKFFTFLSIDQGFHIRTYQDITLVPLR